MLRRTTTNKSTTQRASGRSGVAAAELAVSLPLLLAMVFGSIEATNAIYVKKALVEAAYEAGNVASSVGGTSSVATSRAQGVCTLMGVNSVTVTISPSVTNNTATGTPIKVTCTTTLGANTVTGWIMGNRTLTATYNVFHL